MILLARLPPPVPPDSADMWLALIVFLYSVESNVNEFFKTVPGVNVVLYISRYCSPLISPNARENDDQSSDIVNLSEISTFVEESVFPYWSYSTSLKMNESSRYVSPVLPSVSVITTLLSVAFV